VQVNDTMMKGTLTRKFRCNSFKFSNQETKKRDWIPKAPVITKYKNPIKAKT
jgi:hypothetical protein